MSTTGVLTSIWCDGTGGSGPRGCWAEAAERGGGGHGAAEGRDCPGRAPDASAGHALRLSPRGPGGLPRRPVWKCPLSIPTLPSTPTPLTSQSTKLRTGALY